MKTNTEITTDYECEFCGIKSLDPGYIAEHEPICGCNPDFIQKLKESGIIGKIFRTRLKTKYIRIDSVAPGSYPLRGCSIYVNNLIRFTEYTVNPSDEFCCGSDMVPFDYVPCTVEEWNGIADKVISRLEGGN
ncbi:MAG: hypothetical protein E7Z63_06080 [Thermoplasmata archaeon]|nr:hypothetical protein [Thermoplasmata archaeon]